MSKLLHAFLAIGTATMLALPGAARAQELPAPPEAKDRTPTIEAIIAALDRSEANLETFAKWKELAPEKVQVVAVDEVLSPEAAAASFDQAAERNAEMLSRLRAALGAHETVAGALEAEELTAEHVVAIELPEDGGIVLYVRRRA